MTTDVIDFGCRLNAYEGQLMRGLAAGLTNTVVVNTCAVTAHAERQARQAVRRVVRDRPGARIVVTGCAAQIAPERWASLPGVTRILGNADKLRPESWRDDAPSAMSDIFAAPQPVPTPVSELAGRTRALVQVQQGCDHRCTFCVIPFGRGSNRSVPVEALVARVRALVAAGVQEVVLTGVDIASYGRDGVGGLSLGAAVGQVLAAVPELPRLRLSSLDPAAIDEDLWTLIGGEARLMPHLHLSLQAGSDLILKRMKRRHSVAQAEDVIGRARELRPGIAIGADLIAGFPTETGALFDETLAFTRRQALPFLHVFPYSERPGTPAARMPSVPNSERRARAALLREAGEIALLAFHAAQLGGIVQVLTEVARARSPNGRTQHFSPVRLAGAWPSSQLVRARIVGAEPGCLLAEAA